MPSYPSLSYSLQYLFLTLFSPPQAFGLLHEYPSYPKTVEHGLPRWKMVFPNEKQCLREDRQLYSQMRQAFEKMERHLSTRRISSRHFVCLFSSSMKGSMTSRLGEQWNGVDQLGCFCKVILLTRLWPVKVLTISARMLSVLHGRSHACRFPCLASSLLSQRYLGGINPLGSAKLNAPCVIRILMRTLWSITAFFAKRTVRYFSV